MYLTMNRFRIRPGQEQAFEAVWTGRESRLPEVPGVAVSFRMADGEKCGRCWKILPDVGRHAHPGVCGRCDSALT